jgi:hypothetical protein
MKNKFIAAFLLLVLLPFTALAADTKVTALTADTAPDGADLLMTVDDVAGTPTSKKVTITNLFANAAQVILGSVAGQGTPFIFEGATADGFETSFLVADAAADINVTLPASTTSAGVMLTSLTTNQVDAANSITGTSNGFIAEGATADGFEGTLSFADPTADYTLTVPALPAAAGVLVTSLTTNAVDVANSVTGTSNGFIAEGATADGNETTVAFADPAADFTLTIPASAAAAAPLLTSLTTNGVDVANSVTGTSNGFIAEGATADGFEITTAYADAGADATVTIPATTGTVKPRAATTALTADTAVTLTVVNNSVKLYTDTITTDNQDQTITFSGAGIVGDIVEILFITDAAGSADEVITFHTTLTNSAGTLTLANLASGRYKVVFESDGTVWNEVSRTAALS